MTEDSLNFAAIAIELGVPALLFLGYWLFPSKRTICFTTLVAISPVLLLYLFIAISHYFSPADTDFAFAAMWLMSFAPFMFLLALGLAVGLIRHKAAKRANARTAA